MSAGNETSLLLPTSLYPFFRWLKLFFLQTLNIGFEQQVGRVWT